MNQDITEQYKLLGFTVCGREFVRTEPGEFMCGDIVVFCDQQDSTSWMARKGAVRTGWYWYPAVAAGKLIEALES